MTVLDYGAGRGSQLTRSDAPYRRDLATLHGKVAKLVAVDVDPAVIQNIHCDEAVVIDAGRKLPFEDGSFDLVVADWVIEHIQDPAFFESEVRRVLRPGGWFCARTPNAWGITGMGARLIPNRAHVPILRILQPQREAVDVFPVTYKLNSRRAIRRQFPAQHWNNASYVSNSEPGYFARSPMLMLLVLIFWRFVPRSLYMNLMVFVQRR